MPTPAPNVLIIGALGQLGTELRPVLVERFGAERLVLADLAPEADTGELHYEQLDVRDQDALRDVLQRHQVGIVYHLAALLSAKGEQNPALAWDVNMGGLLNVLDRALENGLRQVFWPSSIAVFGPNSPAGTVPQYCTMDPTTIYGISKLAGERLCEYYHQKHGLDVRSIRYPGLIGYNAPPGGGTTDYAIDVFYHVNAGRPFSCFLDETARLPMMYMPDAVRSTLELMDAPAENLRIWHSYNVGALSFSPAELFAAIRRQRPELPTDFFAYEPDYRQAIAASWPDDVDDTDARADWQWAPAHDLDRMTADMLARIPADPVA